MNIQSASRPFRGISPFRCNSLAKWPFVHVWFSRAFAKSHVIGERGFDGEQRRTVMRKFAKVALGALMMAGAATATTAAMTSPAEARVSVGIGLGFPGYYGPAYYPGYYGPAYYDPYYYPAYPYYGRPYWRGHYGYGWRGRYGYRGGYRGYWR
jgi:hypothetical protein